MQLKFVKPKLIAPTAATAFVFAALCSTTQAADLTGSVQVAGKPVAGADVTLYAAGTGAPAKLAEAKSDNQGAFRLAASRALKDSVLYVVAKGPKEDVELLSVLGATLPTTITVNELTTVASAFTAARFINGEAISGNPLGLRIAAGNAPNLVDPATGSWGKVVLDPINITQTTTLAKLNTLASLITAYSTVTDNAWRARFLKAATRVDGATSKNTLEAMAGIARAPYVQPKELFTLFDEVYPQPKDGSRRKAPFVPYLRFVPDDFALSLCFAGAGCSPMASSCLTRTATSGAVRTGCRARSPASPSTSAVG